MKPKTTWPTLQGRLNNALASEKEALLQLQKIGGVTLSEYVLKKLEKINKNEHSRSNRNKK